MKTTYLALPCLGSAALTATTNQASGPTLTSEALSSEEVVTVTVDHMPTISIPHATTLTIAPRSDDTIMSPHQCSRLCATKFQAEAFQNTQDERDAKEACYSGCMYTLDGIDGSDQVNNVSVSAVAQPTQSLNQDPEGQLRSMLSQAVACGHNKTCRLRCYAIMLGLDFKYSGDQQNTIDQESAGSTTTALDGSPSPVQSVLAARDVSFADSTPCLVDKCAGKQKDIGNNNFQCANKCLNDYRLGGTSIAKVVQDCLLNAAYVNKKAFKSAVIGCQTEYDRLRLGAANAASGRDRTIVVDAPTTITHFHTGREVAVANEKTTIDAVFKTKLRPTAVATAATTSTISSGPWSVGTTVFTDEHTVVTAVRTQTVSVVQPPQVSTTTVIAENPKTETVRSAIGYWSISGKFTMSQPAGETITAESEEPEYVSRTQIVVERPRATHYIDAPSEETGKVVMVEVQKPRKSTATLKHIAIGTSTTYRDLLAITDLPAGLDCPPWLGAASARTAPSFNSNQAGAALLGLCVAIGAAALML